MNDLFPTIARTVVAAAVLGSAAIPIASASASCSAQARSISKMQDEAAALKAERDDLVIEVEDAGDAWEEAEATRLFSPDHASKADLALSAYEARKDELSDIEADLQDKVSKVNARVAQYNSACATRR